MKETPFKDLKTNPFSCFGEDWMALTSGNQTDGYDAMTVARGHLGSIWEHGKHRNYLPTATCFVCPNCYTKTFMDKEKRTSYFPILMRPAKKRWHIWAESHSNGSVGGL